MNAQETLEQLEALARGLSIPVRYEKCRSRGGLCRLRGEPLVIVRRSLTVPEKVEVLARALCRLPREDVYLVPEVRRLLDRTAARLAAETPEEAPAEADLQDEMAGSG